MLRIIPLVSALAREGVVGWGFVFMMSIVIAQIMQWYDFNYEVLQMFLAYQSECPCVDKKDLK